MRRMLAYMRPYWRSVAISVVILLVQSMLQLSGPLLTKIAIDRYLAPTGATSFLDRWLPPGAASGILDLAALYAFLVLVTFLLDFTQTYLMQRTGQFAMFDLRRDLMAKLQQLDVAFTIATRWAA